MVIHEGTGCTLYPDAYTWPYIEDWINMQLVAEIQEDVDLLATKAISRCEDLLIMEEWYEEHELSLEEMTAQEMALWEEMTGIEYHKWQQAWTSHKYQQMGMEEQMEMEEEAKQLIEANQPYVSFLGLSAEWLEEDDDLYEDVMYDDLCEDPI